MGLRKLSEMPEFKVASGSPDIRGWQVVDNSGNPVGRVTELYADPESETVDFAGVRSNSEIHVIPLADTEFDNKTVHLNRSVDFIRSAPSYHPDRNPDEYLNYWNTPPTRAEAEPAPSGPETTPETPEQAGVRSAANEPRVRRVIEEKKTTIYEEPED
jgi:sporulation protein YlmC with PRC-barrel domain